jgi:hypothetical protein
MPWEMTHDESGRPVWTREATPEQVEQHRRAAWRDFNNDAGGFYAGPGTPFYLAEKARLSAIINR